MVSPVGTSTIGTTFLIINAALGAGLLNFPKAFDQAGGIEVALIVQLFLVIFVVMSLLILAKCSDVNGAGTVQVKKNQINFHGCHLKEQIHVFFRQHSRVHVEKLVNILVLFVLLCILLEHASLFLLSLVTNLIEHWPLYMDLIFAVIGIMMLLNVCLRFIILKRNLIFLVYRYMQREFLIPACSIVFILPLCFSLRIDFLKYVSPVGVLSIVYVVILIVFEYFQGDYLPGPIKESPTRWSDVFLVVPAICFGYQVYAKTFFLVLYRILLMHFLFFF